MRAILRTLANAMLTFMFVNGIQSILLTEGLLESSSNFEMCHCTYKTLLTVPLYPISQLGTKNSVTVRNRLLYYATVTNFNVTDRQGGGGTELQ